jgi:ElaB/YqjD/DUF883 family membrane-anchored ribosome-binding protein
MSATAERTSEDLHRSIDKAADSAQPVVERVASTAHASVDKVSGAISGAQQAMSEKRRQLTDAYGHFLDSGRDYVRTSPGTAILAALATGFVLAKIIGRR